MMIEQFWNAFRLQYEDAYGYEFFILSTRFRFGGRNVSKCACSELETRTRSRPCTPIWRSQIYAIATATLSDCACFSANERQKQNQSHLARTIFPALWASDREFVGIPIVSSCILLLLWLDGVIWTEWLLWFCFLSVIWESLKWWQEIKKLWDS